MTGKEKFSFGWWNTSLSPRGRKSTPESIDVATRLVEVLTKDLRLDFIAFGEVSPAEREAFSDAIANSNYRMLDGFQPAGRSRFSTLFVYDESFLSVSSPVSIVAEKGGRTLRVAQRIDATINGFKKPFHIFISHWPSRLHLQESAPERYLLGVRLRDAVDEVYNLYNEIPNIILIGDYNDEPFSTSLTEALLATRDRLLAMRRKHLLYNPFWEFLGAPCEAADKQSLRGSYFHKQGDVTQWRLFDQVMVSSSLLSGHGWILDDDFTRALDLPGYTPLLSDANEIFDHAPIIGAVRRV